MRSFARRGVSDDDEDDRSAAKASAPPQRPSQTRRRSTSGTTTGAACTAASTAPSGHGGRRPTRARRGPTRGCRAAAAADRSFVREGVMHSVFCTEGGQAHAALPPGVYPAALDRRRASRSAGCWSTASSHIAQRIGSIARSPRSYSYHRDTAPRFASLAAAAPDRPAIRRDSATASGVGSGMPCRMSIPFTVGPFSGRPRLPAPRLRASSCRAPRASCARHASPVARRALRHR